MTTPAVNGSAGRSTAEGPGGCLYASICQLPAGRRLRVSRSRAGGCQDVLLDEVAARWLLRWLCSAIYQPRRRGPWRLRLLPGPAGQPGGLLLDTRAALWLLNRLCEFLYQPPTGLPRGVPWFPAPGRSR